MVSIVLNNMVQRFSLRSVMVEAAVDVGALVVFVEGQPVTAPRLACLRVNSEVEVEAHVGSQSGLSILDHVQT